ncbi:hypothetical protein TNCT_100021 [Trichonephila clavata]|uniref:Uncharacterized protein n=1 Tax=Trichonephila clavata TaxID=2740835 RepID=A0A8X6KMK0_TRICU|nr:hypothetical protein TNCT_100021 [Trichonephila clavata]
MLTNLIRSEERTLSRPKIRSTQCCSSNVACWNGESKCEANPGGDGDPSNRALGETLPRRGTRVDGRSETRVSKGAGRASQRSNGIVVLFISRVRH